MIFGLVITKKAPAVTVRDGGRIRCPKCSWEPAKSDRWCCEPGCSSVWNTFDTRGVCPGCEKRWHDTMCLRCGRWSRLDDWYANENG